MLHLFVCFLDIFFVFTTHCFLLCCKTSFQCTATWRQVNATFVFGKKSFFVPTIYSSSSRPSSSKVNLKKSIKTMYVHTILCYKPFNYQQAVDPVPLLFPTLIIAFSPEPFIWGHNFATQILIFLLLPSLNNFVAQNLKFLLLFPLNNIATQILIFLLLFPFNNFAAQIFIFFFFVLF